MKNLKLAAILLILMSCTSEISVIPLSKVNAEKKETARRFTETVFQKCNTKEYSPITGFNISKGFEVHTLGDSLQVMCENIARRHGKVQLGQLVSVQTSNLAKNFMDVYNFQVISEKDAAAKFIHVGMYREGNYIERPFYFNNRAEYYYKKKKSSKK